MRPSKRQIRLWIRTLEKRHGPGTQAFLQDIIGINQRYIRKIKTGERPGYKWAKKLKKAVDTPTKYRGLKKRWEVSKDIRRAERGIEHLEKRMVEATHLKKKALAKKYKARKKRKEKDLEALERKGFVTIEEHEISEYKCFTKFVTLDEMFDKLININITRRVYIKIGRFKRYYPPGELTDDAILKDSDIVAIYDILVNQKKVCFEYGYRIEREEFYDHKHV